MELIVNKKASTLTATVLMLSSMIAPSLAFADIACEREPIVTALASAITYKSCSFTETDKQAHTGTCVCTYRKAGICSTTKFLKQTKAQCDAHVGKPVQ